MNDHVRIDDRYPHADTEPSEHEQDVAERDGDRSNPGQVVAMDPGSSDPNPPSASEDLAADEQPGDESTRDG